MNKMACFWSLLIVLATFLANAACLPESQDAPALAGSNPSISAASILPPILDIGCMTGGGDARMDSLTVKRLSVIYCNQLQGHPLKLAGDNFSAAVYPTDLVLITSSPNYTMVEEDGYIAVFEFFLGSSYVDQNGIIHPQGQPSQCASDNCIRIFDAIVNRCEWNSHYFGGYNQHLSDCGIYSVYTLNCSHNLINPDCARWHSRWQPFYTTTSTSTRHYTNTDFYAFTVTDSSTTITSKVMVSTFTGTEWTSIVPMMFTLDNTYTGVVPNPTFDGPTFTPRFSVAVSTSSSAQGLMVAETVVPIATSTFH